MRRKRINYKPSRPQAAMGLAIGVVFILLGLGMVIPMTFASESPFIGLFGVAWTGIAVYNTVINAKYLFGSRDGKNEDLFGGYEITETQEEPQRPADAGQTPAGLGPKARLEQLETLKSAGLLTPEEYAEKRKEILRGL